MWSFWQGLILPKCIRDLLNSHGIICGWRIIGKTCFKLECPWNVTTSATGFRIPKHFNCINIAPKHKTNWCWCPLMSFPEHLVAQYTKTLFWGSVHMTAPSIPPRLHPQTVKIRRNSSLTSALFYLKYTHTHTQVKKGSRNLYTNLHYTLLDHHPSTHCLS